MRMKITTAILGVALTTLSACATVNSKILTIVQSDKDFYSASYIGGLPGCFPPISNRICRANGTESIYQPKSKLDVKELKVSLSHSGYFLNEKEILYLAAATASLQLGYPKFTVVSKYSSSFCDSFYSANTSGTSGYSDYSGTTRISKDTICASGVLLMILLFRNPTDLENGIFYGIKESNSPLRLIPDDSLYFGTTPGLTYSQFNSFDGNSDSSSRQSNTFMTYVNAYQHYYNADGLAHDLRVKLKVSDDYKVTIEDEHTENARKEANDFFERNSVSSPK